jgi:stage II sporulation protein D
MKVLITVLTAICIILSAQFVQPDYGIAETIKILIVDDANPRIPEKDEVLEKISSKMSGELIMNGVHYPGEIEIWKGQNGLYIMTELPLEEYVKNVVISEVGTKWDPEALKAQAVISRTYALYQKNSNGKSIYHLTSSVLHQAYKGNGYRPEVSYAVEKTAGEILTYNNKLIEALYHSTSSGKTELPEEVFGKSYPYLKSVESFSKRSPYWIWERKIPISEIESALKLTGIKEVRIKSYTSTGRVKEISIIVELGEHVYRSNDFRKLLGWQRLPSTDFDMSKENSAIIFEGKGYGHGVGLCQWSALEMAKKGQTYKEILSYFYPGTEIKKYESR